MSFLESEKASSLLPQNQRDLVYITPQTTIEECLQLLQKHNIVAVPVKNGDKFDGMVDVYQLATYIAFSTWGDNYHSDGLAKPEDLKIPAESVVGMTGVDVVDRRRALWIIPEDESIKVPFEYLAKGVYRLLISNSKTSSYNIVSQTDLVRYILANYDKFGDYKNVNLKDDNFIKPTVTITNDQPVLRGIQIMRLKELHAIAVVNSEGELEANLSISDLRGFTPEKLQKLRLPLKEYLSDRKQPIVCIAEDSLKSAIEKMVNEHVHRVWIVDEKKKPVGLVSMTDVALYFFTKNLDVWYKPEDE